MQELDPLKKKKLKKLVDLAEKGQVALLDQIDELENKLDEGLSTIQESIDTQISAVSEELKKKLESELVLEINREELIGEKGEKGEDGINGVDGKDGKDGSDGIDGKDGVDGLDGKDGKDGSPDTGVQIVDKINELPTDDESLKIKRVHIEGGDSLIDQPILDRAIGILDSRTSFLINKVSKLAESGTGGGSVSPLTTKGDLYGYDTADARIPVGADGEVLTADSTNALGVSWQPPQTGGIFTYYWTPTASDVATKYKQLDTPYPTISNASFTGATNGQLLRTYVTDPNNPSLSFIPAGDYRTHIHANVATITGKKDTYLRAEIWEVTSAGVDIVKLADLGPSTILTATTAEYIISYTSPQVDLASTASRIATKVYAVISGTGGDPDITISVGDGSDSNTTFPAQTVSVNNYVPYTGDTKVKTWTKEATVTKTGLGTTTADAWVADNTTSASNGSQQVSPATRWRGRGWNSGGAGSSQTIDFRKYLLPVQGASGATGRLITQISRNGASYSDIYSQSTTGEIVQTVLSGVSATTGYEMTANFANSDTQTTQHLKLSNAGSYTWTTYYFSSVQKGAFGVDNTGVMRFYGSGNRYLFHTGVTGSSIIAEIYAGGFYNTGGNFNSGRVTAGNNTTSPPTTFSNYGSTSLKTVIIDTPTTLTDDYTQVLVDCSTYNVCSGTPNVTDCGTYTGSGQAVCESHLPCVWDAGTACSIYDNEAGMTSCSGQAGCSVSTSSCSSANNTDQSTCEALDDAYGGSCSWDTATCSAQTSTASCNAITGCTASVTGDCSTLSDGGGDGTNCATQPECSYDSGTGVCSGSYFTSCSGNLCGGDYYNGICNGTFGTACSGTATCSGYGDSGSCAGEAGCSWTSGVDITMPASPVEQTYWIAKDYTSGQLRILPNSGQTINNTTSITSSSTTGVGWMLTWFDSKSNWAIMSKH